MIVTGTNLLAYLLLPTAQTGTAERVLMRDPDWTAPELIHSEFRNVLLGALRRQALDRAEAIGMLDRASEVLIPPPLQPDGAAVLALAQDSGCGAYDCEFAWLARELGVPLVTADRAVRSAFPKLAVAPSDFAAG